MKKGKNKAFTLTELLVVVVVIGVLSAVVLPKFGKVIETRRTTEAEELMASIRTEQEKRCALDKNYLTDLSKMGDIVKNPDTKNYTITLASTGINAARKAKYDYTLKMPSYADGRICCDGDDCDSLNKNYPKCKGFTYELSPASCAGTEVKPTLCETDPDSCECNPNQEKCCSAGTVWNGSSCVVPCNDCTCPEYAAANPAECNPAPCNDCTCPEYAASHADECNPSPKKCNTAFDEMETKNCSSGGPGELESCGIMRRTKSCNMETGEWEYTEWDISGCKVLTAADILEASKEEEDCNTCGKRKRQYVCKLGSWQKEWGECDMTEEDCKKPFVPVVETIAAAKTCYEKSDYSSTDIFMSRWSSIQYARKFEPGKLEFFDNGKNCSESQNFNGGGLLAAEHANTVVSGSLFTYNAVGSVNVSGSCPAGKTPEALCAENCSSSAHSCSVSCLQSVHVDEPCKFTNNPVKTTVNCNCALSGNGYICASPGTWVSGSDGMKHYGGSITTESSPVIGSAQWLHCERSK